MNSNNAPMRPNSEWLGQQVRQMRQRQGLGVRELAGRARVDPSWVSKLEHGKIGTPDPRLLYRLAIALDVEVADLYMAADYRSGRGLPGFAPYLRAKYDLPAEAIAQLQAQFELINDRYINEQKGT